MEFPKNTTRLQFGDFSFVPRNDGRFALFIYLQSASRSRTAFYGSFAKRLVDLAEIEALPAQVQLGKAGLTAIKCYKENNLAISGNLANRIPESDRDAVYCQIADTSIGSVRSVWGYRIILKLANEVAV